MGDNSSPFDFSQYSGDGAPRNTSPSDGDGTPPTGFGNQVGASNQSGFGAIGGFGQPGETVTNGWSAAPGQGLVAPTGGNTPPQHLLFIAIGISVAAGVAALLLGTNPVVAIAAWVLSGPVAIGVFALFTRQDTLRRTNVLYSSGADTTWLYRGGLVLTFAAIVASALRIAFWAGRL